MKQSIRNREGEIFYEAEFNPIDQWIYVRLTGNLTLDDIQKAGDSFLELFKISGVKKLINDTRDVKGEYHRAKYWTVSTMMEELSSLGLDYYAHLTVADQRKVDKITSSLNSQDIEYKAFKSIERAQNWLKKQRE